MCDGFLYFVLTSQNHSDYAAGGSIQNDSLVGPCFGNTGRLLVIILFLAPLPWYPESSCNIRMFLTLNFQDDIEEIKADVVKPEWAEMASVVELKGKKGRLKGRTTFVSSCQ